MPGTAIRIWTGDAMTLLIFVRHGRTFLPGEPARRIGSRTDLPLTAQGEREAQDLVASFMDMPIRAIWSGHLQRSRRTASILAAGLKVPRPVQALRLLDEIDHGPDENRTDAEITARIGTASLAAWNERLAPPHGWDIGSSWRPRGWNRIARVLARRPERECILAVGSQGAIRLAVQSLRDPTHVPAPKLKPGHYGILRLGGALHADMIAWDRSPSGEVQE